MEKCPTCDKEFKALAIHKCKNAMAVPSSATLPVAPDVSAIESRVDGLADRLNRITDSLGTLADAVKTLVEEKNKPAQAPNYASAAPSKEQKEKDFFEKQGVIPPKFRELCDQILSPEFEISIEYFDDSPNYFLHIDVPEKYSSVPQKHREMGVQDRRSRVIQSSLGSNGVRDFFTLVRKNLNAYFIKSGVQSPFINA